MLYMQTFPNLRSGYVLEDVAQVEMFESRN
jgi:hypothetical protein